MPRKQFIWAPTSQFTTEPSARAICLWQIFSSPPSPSSPSLFLNKVPLWSRTKSHDWLESWKPLPSLIRKPPHLRHVLRVFYQFIIRIQIQFFLQHKQNIKETSERRIGSATPIYNEILTLCQSVGCFGRILKITDTWSSGQRTLYCNGRDPCSRWGFYRLMRW